MGGLLRHVPESLIDRVRLIDLADKRGASGVNLLDACIFSDRDRTADSVVRIAKGLWDQWGPRMQSILEQTVKTLHEANEHPATADDEQLTILDALTLLADDKFKNGVLTRVSDPYLLQWRGTGTRRPWWSGPGQGCFCPWPRASGGELRWDRPRRAGPVPSTSPTTCSDATTSTWQGPAWASPH